MGSTQFGNFHDFCRDSTLPVCNLLTNFHNQTGNWSTDAGACSLTGGPSLEGKVANLGSILTAFFAIIMAAGLLWLSERKKAAVGRREMQLFLLGYIIMSICEIFTVGEFPLNSTARVAFSAIHIGMITAVTWVLLLNAVIGYQLLDDGTFVSITLVIASAAVFFIGVGYIALDTGLHWTGYWDSSYEGDNRHIALYVLYQLVPLIFIVVFYVLETILVLRILNEKRPMAWLTLAAIFFALGQVFNYAVSSHICKGTSGRLDGAFFETLCTAIAVGFVWYFWSSITEDDWAAPGTYP